MIRISKIDGKVNSSIFEFGDLNSLSEFILENNWSPGIFNNNYRNIKNFKSISVLALDFDEGLSLDRALEIFKPYMHIIGTSKSHGIDKGGVICDRFRVLLFSSDIIEDKDIYTNTWNYLYSLFPDMDAACKDVSRFYFKCKEIVSIQSEGLKISPKIDFKVNNYVPVVKKVKLENRGSLSRFTKDFLSEGTVLSQGRNHTLYKALIDCREKNYSKDWCKEKFMTSLQDCGFIKDYGVRKFYSTLEQVYEKELRYPMQNGEFKKGTRDNIIISTVELLKKHCNHKFLKLVDEMGNFRILKILEDNEVIPVTLNSIKNELYKHLEMPLLDKYATEAIKTWLNGLEELDREPDIVSFKGTTNYTYHRLQFKPKKGECPTFTEMISNIYNKKALCAYVWSLLEPKSYKQQTLWWFGTGGDGKGSMVKIIQFLFGKSFIGTSSEDYKSQKAFFMSLLVGKRVVAFTDENNRKLLMTNWFKRITGNDPVTINAKNEKAYSMILDVKTMVFSNREPEFDNTKAHLRRIIYCYPEYERKYKVDPKFYDKLHEELPHILQYCKDCYEELTENHGPIEADSFYAEEIAKEKDYEREAFFNEYFTISKDSFVTGSELQKFVRNKNTYDFNYNDFVHYLNTTHGICKSRQLIGDKRIGGYKGLMLKSKKMKLLKEDSNG